MYLKLIKNILISFSRPLYFLNMEMGLLKINASGAFGVQDRPRSLSTHTLIHTAIELQI